MPEAMENLSHKEHGQRGEKQRGEGLATVDGTIRLPAPARRLVTQGIGRVCRRSSRRRSSRLAVRIALR